MSRFFNAVKLAVRNLALHKLRAFLTVLGLIFGVSSVVAMLAIAEGASLEAQRQIADLGATNIILRSIKPIEDVKTSTGANESYIFEYGLKNKDFERIVGSIPTVVGATPLREFRKPIRHLEREFEARIVGANPDCLRVIGQTMAHGRFLSAVDLSRFANVCVVGDEIAEKLFPMGSPIGKSIRIGERHYYPRRGRDGQEGGLRRHRLQPRGPGLQQGRLHPPDHRSDPVRRAPDDREAGELHGREDRAEPDHRRGGRDRQREAHERSAGEPPEADPREEGTTVSRSPWNCWRRPRRRSGSSTWCSGRSRRSRLWWAASGS